MRNLLLLLIIGFMGCKEPTKPKESVTVEKKAPARPGLTDLNDQPVSLDQFKGKTVVINYWATWCKPCIAEMPSIQRAQDLLTKKGIVFLFASNESVDQINEFKKEYNYNFNYLRLLNLEELNIQALPTTHIINRKGELVFSETGARKWDDTVNLDLILNINNQP